MRTLPCLFLVGCLAPANPLPDTAEPPQTVVPTPPDLLQVHVACRPREGLWRLQLRAGGWVGQARTWWTVDGSYVESHALLSHAYDPDGTEEILFLDLPIAPDVRLVEDGELTAFGCGDAPSIRWSVTPPEGPVHACVDTVGAFQDWDSVPGLPACPDEQR